MRASEDRTSRPLRKRRNIPCRSTFRTRTRAEVLSAVQPFIDLEQREVNVRGAAVLFETAEESYFGLIDGGGLVDL